MVNVDSYSAIITKVSNALECVIAPYYYYFFYSVTQFPENEKKLRYAIQKSTKIKHE